MLTEQDGVQLTDLTDLLVMVRKRLLAARWRHAAQAAWQLEILYLDWVFGRFTGQHGCDVAGHGGL